MSFERRTYKGLDYLTWTGDVTYGQYTKLGRVSLIITPDNYQRAADLAEELFSEIEFDALTLDCSTSQSLFDKTQSFDVFAPYVHELIVKDNCGRIDFTAFECLSELLSISTLVPKPKGLRLSAYPKLWRATVGQVDRSDLLENATRLETLRIFRRLNLGKTGWGWLSSLSNLRELVVSQFEMMSLQGIPANETVTRLTVAHPRGLQSLAGIEAMSCLEELEIEGARQLQDYMPLIALKKLLHLAIIESRAPNSLGFLQKLPQLQRSIINGQEIV